MCERDLATSRFARVYTSGIPRTIYQTNRTYAKRKNDAKMKKDLSKSNGKKVYYARLLSVSDK